MSKKENLEQLPAALPWVVGIAAVVLVVFYVGAFHRLPFTEDPSAWGAFGDYAGGLLNPLVSTFTLIVAVKVWRQQKIEMEETKKALEEQAKTAEQQRQEQRFFDLLNVYFRTLDGISFQHRWHELEKLKTHDYKGKTAMAAWLNASPTLFRLALNKDIHGNAHAQSSDESQKADTMVEEWCEHQANEHFGSYFRIVRHLLAEAPSLLGEQHHRYVALFCAQLSRTELVLLALHLWLDSEGQAVQHLASKYGLLTNLPKGDLRTELEGVFPPELFTQPNVSSPARIESVAVAER